MTKAITNNVSVVKYSARAYGVYAQNVYLADVVLQNGSFVVIKNQGVTFSDSEFILCVVEYERKYSA